ncbi:MAG: universal stress protein [Acidobacteria bacterium]|nr:universal stress protein [Acidobacteriota bacterium]
MVNSFRILIGYDGSGFADAAIDDLKNAGLPADVEALVLSVAEVWLPPRDEGKEPEFVTPELARSYKHNLGILQNSRELADAAAVRLRAMFPTWEVESDATYGSAAWEILFRAEDFKPDLIVVGAQGVFGLKELLIGSVAQKIVTEAPCSVRVARGKVEVEPTTARIVLGYDGTAGSDKTVESIIARNWPDESEVKVVLVQDTALIRSSFEIEDDKVEQSGHAVVDKLRNGGLKATLVIREGNPKHVIVEEAEIFRADTIFLGATKFDDLITKYLLGSVSSAIVTRAKCSVEIVRPKRS